jgi:predicted TIM-barrel fold metal-dependent hydrolase
MPRIAWLLAILVVVPASADEPLDGREGRQLLLENFRPQPALKVKATELAAAKFPVIDVHTHFRLKLRMEEQLDDFVRVMDRNRIAMCVSLDGRLGEELTEHIRFLGKYPDRFAVLANIDWRGAGKADDPATWDLHSADFGRRMAEALRDAKKRGAVGLKIFKDFGLTIKNPDGSLVRVDDERWDPIWEACGELGFPILIHTADPIAFFEPIDEKNERWEELHRHPDWSFHGAGFPTHRALLDQLMAVVKRHPKTNFIAAHLANSGEDFSQLSEWLDAYPNLYVDIASRINELGRQPYSARTFLMRYQDRVLFGTDGPWPQTRLRLYWRFLETDDEYFPYSEKDFPPQGLWQIYGVYLPDETLGAFYSQNVLRLMPALTKSYEKFGK